VSAISDSSVAGQRFEETAWSVVIAAGADSSPRAHHALAELCRAYWPPIYGYLNVLARVWAIRDDSRHRGKIFAEFSFLR
jgi:hypothetical protein